MHAYQAIRTFLGWRHQMETFSALLIHCAGNSSVIGEFPAQRPVTWSFDVSFDLHLDKFFSKQSWGWWFETPLRSLWRHRNGLERNCRWFCSGLNVLTINTLRPRQNGRHFQTTFSNVFSWMKMYEFRLKFHWTLFLRVQLTISQHWFR